MHGYLALPVYEICKRIIRDQPSPGHLCASEAGAMPCALCNGGHVVDGGRCYGMDAEEVDKILQDLSRKVRRETL